MNPTTVDAGAPLTPRDVVAVARLGAQVPVADEPEQGHGALSSISSRVRSQAEAIAWGSEDVHGRP